MRYDCMTDANAPTSSLMRRGGADSIVSLGDYNSLDVGLE